METERGRGRGRREGGGRPRVQISERTRRRAESHTPRLPAFPPSTPAPASSPAQAEGREPPAFKCQPSLPRCVTLGKLLPSLCLFLSINRDYTGAPGFLSRKRRGGG